MARLKKNRLNNILFPMVDKATGLSVLSSLDAVDITVSLWGVAHGVSTAASAITVSKAVVAVHSGIFQQTFKAAETDAHDMYIMRMSSTSTVSAAVQMMVLEMVDNDDTDIYSQLTALSNIVSQILGDTAYISNVVSNMSGILSDTYSNLVAHSNYLSQVHSDLKSAIGNVSVTLTASDISDIASAVLAGLDNSQIASAVWSEKYNTYSAVASTFGSFITQQTQYASNLLSNISVIASDAHSAAILAASTASTYGKGNSDILSQVLGDTAYISNVVSNMSGILSDTYSMLAAHSNVLSQVLGDTSGLAGADVSDMASAVWSAKYNTYSLAASTFGSFVTQQLQGASNLLSGISAIASDAHSAALLAASHASAYGAGNSNILSQVLADTTGLNGANTSDIGSAVWAQHYAAHSLASSFGSLVSLMATGIDNSESRTLRIMSDTSDILSNFSDVLSDILSGVRGNSDTLSKMGGPEHIASLVWDADKGSYVDASSMGSILQAATATPSAVAARVWSDFESKVGSTVSDMYSGLAAAAGITPSQIWDYPYSDVTVGSTMGSMLRVAASNVSTILARVPKEAAARSQLSTLASDIESSIASQTSDLRSQISTVGGATASEIADKVWSDFQSKVGQSISNVVNFLSTVVSDAHSAAILAASTASVYGAGNSNILSQILDDVTGLNGADLSDIGSAVWAQHYAAHSLASSFGSLVSLMATGIDNTESRTLVIESQVSDVESALDSQFAYLSNVLSGLSGQISDVESQLDVTASVVSDVQSAVDSQFAYLSNVLSGISGQISDVESQIDAGITLTASNARLVADSVLNRNLATGGSGNSRNVQNALRALRNKTNISSSILNVYQENDTTVAWSAAISTASGNPITGVDPD